jgi:CHAT domain-containing protein
MYYSLLNKIALVLLISSVLAIYGCGRIMVNMPAPPEALVKIELKGPYDGDIPEKFVTQLKNASIMFDRAVPYIFMSVGMHFEFTGDEVRASHFYDRAISESSKRKDIYGEAIAINRKIIALYEFGKMRTAFHAFKEARKKWSSVPLASFVYYNYGHYYLMNGDYKRAQDYFRQSFQANQNFRDNYYLLMLRRDCELEYGIALIMNEYFPAISNRYSVLGFDDGVGKAISKNSDQGISHLNQVIALNEEIRKTKLGRLTPDIIFQVMESNVYNFLGLAYGINGQTQEAMKMIETSAQLVRTANFRVLEVHNIFFRNQVYLLGKNIAEGQNAVQQLNSIADKYHLSIYRSWAKFISSRYHISSGDTQKAISDLKEAITIMEKQRPDLLVATLKGTYMFNRQMLYDALIEILVKEGDDKGALETAERAKSLMLVDLLAEIDTGKNQAETELIKQFQNHVQEMADGYIKLLAANGDNLILNNTLNKIEGAESANLDIISKIKVQNEELYSLISVEPLDINYIIQLLDKNITLFSYYVTDKTLYVWAVNKDRVHLERIKITREEVANLVSSCNKAIAAKDKDQANSLLEKAYETFLKPIIPFVSGDRIGFIPHGSLHYLPFAAMSYKGQYLVDGFSIFQIPNAGMLKYVLKKQSVPCLKLLAFGNPDLGSKKFDLPYAEAELESIKKIIPQANIFLRGAATKSKAKDLIGNYDIIHFAAQGLFVENDPMNSGLMLSPTAQDEDRLTAAEIFRLQLKGRLVLMSASKVSPGLSATGAEIVGLNSSFLYAGSTSVVSTLWNINDKSTAVFMSYFYKNLKKNESIADSLRVTQNEMIRLGYLPFDWAAYILTGKY